VNIEKGLQKSKVKIQKTKSKFQKPKFKTENPKPKPEQSFNSTYLTFGAQKHLIAYVIEDQ
jgi:hypothetical protein